MRQITLDTGAVAIVDDDDFEILSARRWYETELGYARTQISGKTVRMHRLIVGLEGGDKRVVDHINGNTLDNRKENLRICTRGQNLRNCRIRSTNRTGLKGVTKIKNCDRWQARIVIDGKQKWLGTYNNPEEAHEVYCLAADMLHGEFANHGKRAA